MQHAWKLDTAGEVDMTAADDDHHSGPMCLRCYESFCTYCEGPDESLALLSNRCIDYDNPNQLDLF
jgi:hypothetical protein